MKSYQVGNRYMDAIRPEGVFFDIDDNGGILQVYFPGTTQKEVESFESGHPMEIRYVDMGNFIMMLFKFDGLNWIEAPYNPIFSLNLSKIPDPEQGEGLGVTIMLFDSLTGELKVLRLISFGDKFTQKFLKDIKILQEKSCTYEMYTSSVDKVQAVYQTKDIVNRASNYYKIR